MIAAKRIALLVCSLLYWHAVCRAAGVSEPWDADDYWNIWYPISLAGSGLAGPLLVRHGWLGGLIVTFAQLPIMWRSNGNGPLWLLGLLMLCTLAVPAVAASALTSRLAARRRAA